MQGNARDSLGVTREAGRADEQQATFQGRGNSTVEHSVRVLVPCKDVVFSDWRPARNERQHLHPAVTFPRSRANPASLIPGRCSMTAFASGGQVMCGAEGGMHVRVWGELHTICPEDLGRLLFVGERVSLFTRGAENVSKDSVSGSVSLSPSGRAVIIASGSQRYMLPRDRFLAVALGEEISCIFVEVPADTMERELLPASPGRITP